MRIEPPFTGIKGDLKLVAGVVLGAPSGAVWCHPGYQPIVHVWQRLSSVDNNRVAQVATGLGVRARNAGKTRVPPVGVEPTTY